MDTRIIKGKKLFDHLVSMDICKIKERLPGAAIIFFMPVFTYNHTYHCSVNLDILDMIQRFVLPSESRSVSINYGVATQGKKRRLGSMKGQKFIADGHDIDECNDEIARLFEVDD